MVRSNQKRSERVVMKRFLSFTVFSLASLAMVFAVGAAELKIVSSESSRARIVSPSSESATKFAASELSRYIEKMTGAKIPVVENDRSTGEVRFELDDAAEGLGFEEFKIQTKGRVVAISGGSPRAVLYAVYELLEHFGCGFWSPVNESVPSVKNLVLDTKWTVASKPAFAWRQVHSQYGYNTKWKPKARINGRMWTYPIPENLGGWESMAMGQSLAGLNNSDPAKKLFADHPEWFAWREKEQKHVRHQMCTLNDDVVAAIIAKIRAKYKKNPSKICYESVSMRDNANICQCKKCRRFAKAHGGTAALIAECANRVAKDIAKDLPNVRIVFLAYWITSSPPKNLKLEPNVTVCWAMLRNFAVPPSKVPGHDAKLDRWRELANDNVVIWDYNAQFRGFLLPTPIIDMMGPGLREYEKKNVKGVLMQMAGFGAILMDFAELRTWLCARLMWNPNQDEWALINKWCDGACGAGAADVKAYLQLRKTARDRKKSCGPYNPDSLSIFTPKELLSGYALMKKALKATEGDKRTHEQVRRIYLAPLTAVIVNYNRGVKSAAKSAKIDLPDRDRLVDEFEGICTEYKVKSFGEGMPSIAEFIKLMREGGELLKKK